MDTIRRKFVTGGTQMLLSKFWLNWNLQCETVWAYDSLQSDKNRYQFYKMCSLSHFVRDLLTACWTQKVMPPHRELSGPLIGASCLIHNVIQIECHFCQNSLNALCASSRFMASQAWGVHWRSCLLTSICPFVEDLVGLFLRKTLHISSCFVSILFWWR